MIGKKIDTEQAVNLAVGKVTDDIGLLSSRRDCALSVFRSTANELQSVNEGLAQKLSTLNALQDFISGQSDQIKTMMGDNAAVRNRIMEIIGG